MSAPGARLIAATATASTWAGASATVAQVVARCGNIAVINSSQWATAQVNFFNAYNGPSKCFMPALDMWIQGAIGNQRWDYCTPDSYATIAGTPTEGAALTDNSPVWIAMSSRNQGLPN